MRASSYELLRLLNIGIVVISFYFICKSLLNVDKVFRKKGTWSPSAMPEKKFIILILTS